MPDTDSSLGLLQRFSLIALAALLPLAAYAQDLTPPAPTPPPNPSTKPATSPTAQSAPASQGSSSAIDQLAQSNRELLDLLKKQQGVLEDMQYDRRLESRQIENLEIRLTETLNENAELQAKVAQLQAKLDAPPPSSIPATNSTPTAAQPPPATPPPAQPPPEPASYLPPPEPEGAPGTESWHRIYTLSGDDNETSDPFHISGTNWRVIWHNQDKDGATYKNTSALFINAFAKGDTIPQKICSKLGSGGDSTDLAGPGDFVLKIEASGGKWELAVEDFH